MRNTFFEKSYTNCGGETSPRPFYKKSKLSISLDQQSSMLYSLFVYQNILKLKCSPLGFTLYKFFFFKKKKGGLELVSQPHFLHDFWRKIFLEKYFTKDISIKWPNFIDWFLFLLEILGNICVIWEILVKKLDNIKKCGYFHIALVQLIEHISLCQIQ